MNQHVEILYKGMREALLAEGLRGTLAKLVLDNKGKRTASILGGVAPGSFVEGLLLQKNGLRIEGVPPLNPIPPEEQEPFFVAALEAKKSNDAQWVRLVEDFETTGLDRRHTFDDRILREEVREALEMPKRHPKPFHLEEAAFEQGFNIASEVPPQTPLASILRMRERADLTFHRLNAFQKDDALAQKDLGFPTLHAVLGVLRLREGKTQEVVPMLLQPLRLEASAKGGTICALGDPFVNPLLEKILSEHQMRPPPFDGDVESWFEAFAQLLENRPIYTLNRIVALGNISLADILLWKDTDPETWPTAPTDWPLLRQYLADTSALTPLPSIPLLENYPLPSDSTQRNVLKRAAFGESFIVEGPPGAGKSQTIVNMIAQALAGGQKILFVAEKRAAVEVVRQRLERLGLQAFCLDLHGGGSDAVPRLTASLQKRLHLSKSPPNASPPSTPREAWEALLSRDNLLQDQTEHYRAWETWLEAIPAREHLKPFSHIAWPKDLPKIESDALLLGQILENVAHAFKPLPQAWEWVLKPQHQAQILSHAQTLCKLLEASSLDQTLSLTQSRKQAITLSHLPSPQHKAVMVLQTYGLQALVAPISLRDMQHHQSVLDHSLSLQDLMALNQAGYGALSPAEIKDLLSEKHQRQVLDTQRKQALQGFFKNEPTAFKEALRWKDKISLVITHQQAELFNIILQKANLAHVSEIYPWDDHIKDTLENAQKSFPQSFFKAARQAKKTLKTRFQQDPKTNLQSAKTLCWIVEQLQPTPQWGLQDLKRLLEERFLVVAHATAHGLLEEHLEGLRAWDGIWPTEYDPLDAVLEKASHADGSIQDQIEQVFQAQDALSGMLKEIGVYQNHLTPEFYTLLENGRQSFSTWSEETKALATKGPFALEQARLQGCNEVEVLQKIDQHLQDLCNNANTRPLWADGSLAELYTACQEMIHTSEGLSLHQAWKGRVEALPELQKSLLHLLQHHLPAASLPEILVNLCRVRQTQSLPALPDVQNALLQIDAHDKIVESSVVRCIQRLRAPLPLPQDRLLWLEKIAGQKRPKDSVRDLWIKSDGAFHEAFPCLFIDPSTAAQILPKLAGWDICLLDEASQMRPADALPALLRSKQTVIFGDSKQLAPTAFFRKADTVEQEESVLAQAAMINKKSVMQWHYRSKDSSLIQYSNDAFYNGELIVLPSGYQKCPGFGLERVDVPGSFEDRKNIAEAEAIVQEALRIAKSAVESGYTGPSLGLIAMNMEQASLIEEAIDAIEDPAWKTYCAYWKAQSEEPFVRNLENVQGDERDVILISTTYGPASSGVQSNNLGALNKQNGWRRLNVLLTRARHRMVIYTSLNPLKMKAPNKDSGIYHLKNFLQEAAVSTLETPAHSAKEFEKWLYEKLKHDGFQVFQGLGHGNDRIPLSIRKDDGWVAAIEFEGSAFHLDSVDRLQLRPKLLKNLGWRVINVDPQAWWECPKSSYNTLKEQLETAPVIVPPQGKYLPLMGVADEEEIETPVLEEYPTIRLNIDAAQILDALQNMDSETVDALLEEAQDHDDENDLEGSTFEERLSYEQERHVWNQRMEIRYLDRKGEYTEREIQIKDAYTVSGELTYVIAHCFLRKARRTFNVENIWAVRLPNAEWIEGKDAVIECLTTLFEETSSFHQWKKFKQKAGAAAWIGLVGLAKADGTFSRPKRNLVCSFMAELAGFESSDPVMLEMEDDFGKAQFSFQETQTALRSLETHPQKHRIGALCQRLNGLRNVQAPISALSFDHLLPPTGDA